jgi:hypothetical protein
MAKKGTSVVRTTISVPRDLKRRMEKVKEPVNWSAVACRAFEDKLGEIATKKEKKTMEDVIERLRASKRQSDSDDHQWGRECGESWVKDSADARDLERLEALFERSLPGDWQSFFDSRFESTAHTTAERFYFEIVPGANGDSASAADFWETIAGEDSDLNDEFVRGVAEGALDIWRKIKNQL